MDQGRPLKGADRAAAGQNNKDCPPCFHRMSGVVNRLVFRQMGYAPDFELIDRINAVGKGLAIQLYREVLIDWRAPWPFTPSGLTFWQSGPMRARNWPRTG